MLLRLAYSPVPCHSYTGTLFIPPNVAHPIPEKSYFIKLSNPQSSIFKSGWPIPLIIFFNSSFTWITHNNQPVEIFAKLLAFCINLIAYQYFPAIEETKVSLWIEQTFKQTSAIEICCDLGYWEIIKVSRCLLKDLFYFADSETC